MNTTYRTGWRVMLLPGTISCILLPAVALAQEPTPSPTQTPPSSTTGPNQEPADELKNADADNADADDNPFAGAFEIEDLSEDDERLNEVMKEDEVRYVSTSLRHWLLVFRELRVGLEVRSGRRA